jgi:hypothetical protein
MIFYMKDTKNNLYTAMFICNEKANDLNYWIIDTKLFIIIDNQGSNPLNERREISKQRKEQI